ncbi:MAG: SUMF1/EgtB/PvdO family nonheme iron enzyme [Muribaculaceae bacterium]
MMRGVISILIALLSLSVSGQELSIKSFSEKTNDLSASVYRRLDGNDVPCALVKVQMAASGATFEGLVVGDSDFKVNEYWVYMAKGSKRLTIKHPNYVPAEVVFGDYGVTSLESKMTYVLVVLLPNNGGVRKPVITSQYVMFEVEPADAIVEFDGEILDVTDGTAMARKPFGAYPYKVSAPLCHATESLVMVNDPNNKHIVRVSLSPAYGYIDIPGTDELRGAKVYIDDEYKGIVPYKSEKIASGTHNVKITKNMYSSIQQQVSVRDNETTTLSSTLKADFAEVTLSVGNDAEIWVNNEIKGTGIWKGALASGSYIVECKKANHTETSKEITIAREMTGQTITLEEPMPILGMLDITSMPANAEVMIDEKVIGTTPIFIPEQVVGTHMVKISKAGYSTYNEQITLSEGETKQIDATLSSGRSIRITCETDGSHIYVDGQDMGVSPFEGALSYGVHSVYAMNGEKKTAERSVNVTEGNGAMADVSLTFIEKEVKITVNGVTFEMVYVPGGTFIIGGTEEQGHDAYNSEKPTHNVTLSGFYIGKYEVTQRQWRAIMGNNNRCCFKGDNLPVERASWNDCQMFIQKLSNQTGKNFSLPTEAEWEYAARGGASGGTKYSGSNKIDDVAWTYENSGSKTHPVGSKKPNSLGIYDMSGNVKEWCQDLYGKYFNYSQTNPTGSKTGTRRVHRGGGFIDTMWGCRVSHRNGDEPVYSRNDIGLRIVMRIEE